LWPLAGAVLGWIEIRPWLESRSKTNPPKGWGAGDEGRSDAQKLRFFVSRLSSFVILYSVALAVSAWWFVRNFVLYRDWLGWSAFLDTVGRRPHPATLLQLWGERVGFVQAYWGLFGGVSVPLPGWTYVVLNGLVLLAAIGLMWGAVQALRRRQVSADQLVLWGLLAAWIVVMMVGLVRWTSLTWASQGRLIFPAISAIGVLSAAGLVRLWRGLPWLGLAFMGTLTAMAPFAVIGPHYQPPPPLTSAQLAQIPATLNGGAGVDFGGEMKLLGFRLQENAAAPGQSLHLILYWQSQIAMDRNWSIFVHVVDDQGVIVAQRDRYPGMGSLATTLLRPGQTFADEYVIAIPDVSYAAAAAQIEVGLYDLMDGTRLPLATGGDALFLAPVSVVPRPALSLPGVGVIPNPIQRNFASQIELAGYDLDRRSVRPGETLQLTLYWRAIGPIAKNYSVFAHVRGTGETLWAGQDSWPQHGAAPTSTWRQGVGIRDPYQLTLKPDTPPGQYTIEVGLYDAAGDRLRLFDPNGVPTDSDFVYLSHVRVEAP
jgi:hypothetical protein